MVSCKTQMTLQTPGLHRLASLVEVTDFQAGHLGHALAGLYCQINQASIRHLHWHDTTLPPIIYETLFT